MSEGIGRDEEYQRKVPLLDRRKLSLPRNTEGEPNLRAWDEALDRGSEAHELIRSLQRELGSQKEFVGVTLAGSVMRGHFTDESDIDVVMLWDNSRGNDAAPKLRAIYEAEIQRLKERNILHHRVHDMFISINPDALRRHLTGALATAAGEGEETQRLVNGAIVSLCGPIVGPEVERYRAIVRDILLEMPVKKIEEKLGEFVIAALQFEERSQKKREERITSLKRHNTNKSDRARARMWYARIAITLGVGERTT